MTKLPIPYFQCKDLSIFVAYWSSKYSYADEGRYLEIISKPIFDSPDLKSLFHWKNGMILSKSKRVSFEEKVLKRLDEINAFKSNEKVDLEGFKKAFLGISAVWKFFILHIIWPETFPIYDQNVHRAYNYIHLIPYQDISSSFPNNRKKEEFYFTTYLEFVRNSAIPVREVDKALFTFGQFIKKYDRLVEMN